MGIIISIVNNKGGVGKTTISCNLSVALTHLKQKVLVVDIDSQCNATGILIPSYVNIKNSLYELLDPESDTRVSVHDCIYLSKYKNLYCLPNVEETAGLELDLISKYPESLKLLRNKLDLIKEEFDIIIIDNPPNMGIFVANSLYASDFVIIPVEASSAYSLDGLRRAFDLIETIKEAGNPDLRFVKIVINKVDRRTKVAKSIINDIKIRFDSSQMFQTFIPFNTAVQKAEYVKQTVFYSYPSSRAAKAFRDLGKELLSELNKII